MILLPLHTDNSRDNQVQHRTIMSVADTSKTTPEYLPGLDALRALAISVVFFYHSPGSSKLAFFEGRVGVVLFFVISGFLITNLLLRDMDRGKFSLRDYLIRRTTRIMPLYFAVLAAYILIVFVVGSAGERDLFGKSLVWLATMNGDIATSLYGVSVPFSVSWSIGVEEKFYLVWPVLLMLAGRRHGPKAAAAIAVAAAAGSVALVSGGYERAALFSTSPYVAVAAGCLLAFTSWSSARQRPVLLLFGIAALLAVQPWRLRTDGYMALTIDFMVVLVSIIVVRTAVAGSSGTLERVLEHRVVRWIGTRSYGLYLTHKLGILVAKPAVDLLGLNGNVWRVVAFTSAAALSVVLAEVAYRCIETPLRRWGRSLTAH